MKKRSKWLINVGESNIFGFYWLPLPPHLPKWRDFASKTIWCKVFGLVGSNSKMTAGELVVFYKLLSGSNSFCSRNELPEILQCRVNMAPTKHHPVIKHRSCANQRRWMNGHNLFVQAFEWMQPYVQTPSLEKICSIYSYNPNEIYFLCAVMSMGKSNNKKKTHYHMYHM